MDTGTKRVLSSMPFYQVSCVDCCNLQHNQDNYSIITKIYLVLSPLESHLLSSSPSSLIPGKPQSVLHIYNFVFLRLIYKYNHILYDFLRWSFFTQHSILKIIQVLRCINTLFLFIAN